MVIVSVFYSFHSGELEVGMPEPCDSCGCQLNEDEHDRCDGCQWTLPEIIEEDSDGT